eukprot:4008476-Lingulodinium_polyedra.AAC.1
MAGPARPGCVVSRGPSASTANCEIGPARARARAYRRARGSRGDPLMEPECKFAAFVGGAG